MRNFWKKMLGPFGGGGIRRRLLIWGLSLFGIALLVVVVAGYFYMVRQIRQDASALQFGAGFSHRRGNSQLCATKDRAVFGYRRRPKPLSIREQGAAVTPRAHGQKRRQFRPASMIDWQGMEILKVSDRKVYFPSDLTDQSKSLKFIKAL